MKSIGPQQGLTQYNYKHLSPNHSLGFQYPLSFWEANDSPMPCTSSVKQDSAKQYQSGGNLQEWVKRGTEISKRTREATSQFTLHEKIPQSSDTETQWFVNTADWCSYWVHRSVGAKLQLTYWASEEEFINCGLVYLVRSPAYVDALVQINWFRVPAD